MMRGGERGTECLGGIRNGAGSPPFPQPARGPGAGAALADGPRLTPEENYKYIHT